MRRLFLILCTVVAAAACNSSDGGDDTVGRARMQRFLERDLPPEGAAPIEIDQVRCPRPAERGKTTTYTCSVTIQGALVEVHVDERNDELTRREAVLVVATLEAFVVQQYEAQLGVGVMAECSPDALLAVGPGESVACTATDAEGATQTAQVVVEDLDGTATLDLIP
jgi:hypothetical protein